MPKTGPTIIMTRNHGEREKLLRSVCVPWCTSALANEESSEVAVMLRGGER